MLAPVIVYPGQYGHHSTIRCSQKSPGLSVLHVLLLWQTWEDGRTRSEWVSDQVHCLFILHHHLTGKDLQNTEMTQGTGYKPPSNFLKPFLYHPACKTMFEVKDVVRYQMMERDVKCLSWINELGQGVLLMWNNWDTLIKSRFYHDSEVWDTLSNDGE
jgi:hypothetical protein